MLAPALAPRLTVQLDELDVHLLTFADEGKIDKVGDRLAVVHRRTARNNERRERRALARVQRNARKVEHIDHRRERHFIADGKGDDVKIADGVERLQRVERNIGPAHLLLHIAPGREAALAPHALDVVHHAVENAHTKVRHTDLIGIGEAEGDARVDLAFILHNGIEFPADITRRLLHAGQNAFQSLIHESSPQSKQ